MDNSFGNGGIVILALSNWFDQVGEIALQQDGKIVVAGLQGVQNTNSNSNIPFILRLNTDGSFDENFGSNRNGIVVQDFRDIYVQIRSLCILPDGKIIMGGEEDWIYGTQMAIFKYNSTGSLDESFGNRGIMETNFEWGERDPNEFGSFYDILVLPDGRLFCAGSTAYAKFLLCQFNADGSTDNSFGDGRGYVTYTNLPTYAYGRHAHLAKGDKILVFGTYFLANGLDDGTGVYRFNNDGSLDSSFGTNGIAVSGFDDIGGLMSRRASAVQPDGKIVTGVSVYPDYDDEYAHIGLMRFNGDGGISPAGYVRIKKWMKKYGITWAGAFVSKGNTYTVERSTDGHTFIAIASVKKSNNMGEYAYEDPSPAKGKNYYRLSYITGDGKKLYSNAIIIEEVRVQVSPNPVINTLQINGLSTDTKARLYIVGIGGIIKMATTATTQNFSWNVAGLNKGYYLLRIETGNNELVHKKFFKE